MSKHTPGPWQEDDCRDACGCTTIRVADNTPHGQTDKPPIATVNADGDARLIAAAPEMLEALEEMEFLAKGRIGGINCHPGTIKKVRALISKAKGE